MGFRLRVLRWMADRIIVRHAPQADEKVRVPVLGPVVLAVLSLLIVALTGIYALQERRVDERVRDQVHEAGLLLKGAIHRDAQGLQGFSGLLARDRSLQQLWLAGDRALLLEAATPLLDELRSNQGITHLYFHDPDRVCFLRVHEPRRHGDRVDRITLREAARTGLCQQGVELGLLGTLTLRAVQPWWIDGRPAGYIELGEEIGRIIPMIKDILDVELVVVLDKQYLSKGDWKAGMETLGREIDWDLSSGFVVADTTLRPVPTELLSLATSPLNYMANRQFRVEIGGATYRSGVCPLLDAAQRRVGAVVVLKNVDAMETASLLLYGRLVAAGAVIAALLVVSFRWYIRRIERRLTAASDELKGEIQKRRSVEEELTRHRENLEVLVSRRTAELQTANEALGQEIAEHTKTQKVLAGLNQDLESAVQKLSMSNSDLQDLLRIAAHDLKAPVRSMGTLVDWLREDYSDGLAPQGRDYLDLLRQRTHRLDRHLDRILEYAAIGEGNGPAERVELGMLLPEVIAGLQVPSHIQIRAETELPAVEARRDLMTLLFVNLLDNAVKYMDKPQGRIIIGCRLEQDAWEFSIRDNGPGIAKEYHEKVFAMFQTLAPRDQVEATGIGLSIAKRIVELYGGRIGLESAPGQGSTFFFTLPCDCRPRAPEAAGSLRA